jgi:hypothetical protein
MTRLVETLQPQPSQAKTLRECSKSSKSSLNGGNTGQISGNWHRLSPDTGVRVNTALGVWIRAMSNGGYLLSKESSRL